MATDPERDTPRTCTAHFADLAITTLKENDQNKSQACKSHINTSSSTSVEYISCLKHKKAMKNLLQIIIDYVEENEKKSKEEDL